MRQSGFGPGQFGLDLFDGGEGAFELLGEFFEIRELCDAKRFANVAKGILATIPLRDLHKIRPMVGLSSEWRSRSSTAER